MRIQLITNKSISNAGRHFLTMVSCVVMMIGCASNVSRFTDESRLITSNFSLEGLKITYDTSGNLDSIEVFGQAPANRQGYKVIAEADAKSKLVKFLHGESIRSEDYVITISKDITKAIGSGQDTQRYAQQINFALIQSITNMTSQGRLTGMRKIDEQFVSNGTVYVAVYKWSRNPSSSPDSVMPKNLKPVITL